MSWLTSCPRTQYATTVLACGSSFAQAETRAGSRRNAPAIMSEAARNAGGLRTSITSGDRPLAKSDCNSLDLIDASMASDPVQKRAEAEFGREASWRQRGICCIPTQAGYYYPTISVKLSAGPSVPTRIFVTRKKP